MSTSGGVHRDMCMCRNPKRDRKKGTRRRTWLQYGLSDQRGESLRSQSACRPITRNIRPGIAINPVFTSGAFLILLRTTHHIPVAPTPCQQSWVFWSATCLALSPPACALCRCPPRIEALASAFHHSHSPLLPYITPFITRPVQRHMEAYDGSFASGTRYQQLDSPTLGAWTTGDEDQNSGSFIGECSLVDFASQVQSICALLLPLWACFRWQYGVQST